MSDGADQSTLPSVSPAALARAHKSLQPQRELQASGPDSAVGSLPWVWANLDPESLEAAWQDLAQWLATEAAAHAVADKVPSAWWRYPALVRQLAALRHWQTIANRVGSHPREAVEWEETFYRMIDLVWPRYVGLGQTKDEIRHRDRTQRADEELTRFVASAIAERTRISTPIE